MTHTPLYVRIVMARWADHVTGRAAEVVQLRRG